MHDAVDGRGRRHLVFEDLSPLAEHEVARDRHASSFVSLCQKREQHLHLLAALLHVAQVVEDDGVVAVEAPQGGLEREVALGREQALDEFEGGHEEHLVAPLDELVAESGDQVGLAPAG